VDSFKRFFVGILTVITISSAGFAQDGESGNVFINTATNIINALGDFVFSTINVFGTDVEWVVAFLAAPMIILTLYFGFINLKSFPIAYKIIRGRYHDENAPGEVTQFQALATALSGTVGLGNIAGVAIAIAKGGPGATLWMIIIGLLAMTLKFAECTLGVKYRTVRADGTIAGGPMYYLQKGLKEKGWAKAGLFLAWAYGILALPTLLQVAQVNQAYSQLSAVTGLEGNFAAWAFGAVFAGLTAIVIIGGIRSIANVTSKLVPLMCMIYILAALFVIIGNITEVPGAFATIISSAMNPEAATGGVLGVIVIGMQRAVYSSEAGLGSATMAHAAAKTNEPVSEGMVALMEPFIDTVVVCTMTALVIVITGTYTIEGYSDIQMTSAAFGSVISWFPAVLAVAVLMFAFSTVISWGYYAGKIWEFVVGGSNSSMAIFKIIFCAALIPGAVFTSDTVFTLMDSMFFLMAIPNIIGIYILAPEIKRDVASYLARLKSGEIKETKV
jgi:AGCS family alanine or glycine:cation symporter